MQNKNQPPECKSGGAVVGSITFAQGSLMSQIDVNAVIKSRRNRSCDAVHRERTSLQEQEENSVEKCAERA